MCANNKFKKQQDTVAIEMVRTRDILASVAAIPDGPFTVGFAAETENLKDHALSKFHAKKLDLIIANRVGENLAFDCDNNAVEVYWASGERTFPDAPKTELAVDLVALIAERYAAVDEDKPRLSVVAHKD
jgi:phosphopantothenoylcysteine decarboxylase/phosphopantothenate--cysteine ligase